MRLRLAVAASAVCALALAADGPDFRATLTLVKADISVYDRQTHAPILDLQASDFRVVDEDQPRDIVWFGNDGGPLDLILLLDVSGSVLEVLPKIADAANDALSVLQPEDRAAVMAFSKRTVLTQPLTGGSEAVADGIRAATQVRIGLDTDINQALWSAADYLHRSGGASRRAVLVLTDNMQVTHVPDALVNEQLSESGAVLDGLLLRGPIGLPHITHPGILGFARNTGGEVMEGSQPAAKLAEMIRRIKFRYNIHFRPVETGSPRPRHIQIDLTPEARRRYPNAVVRARRLYFPHGAYKPKPLDGQTVAQSGAPLATQ